MRRSRHSRQKINYFKVIIFISILIIIFVMVTKCNSKNVADKPLKETLKSTNTTLSSPNDKIIEEQKKLIQKLTVEVAKLKEKDNTEELRKQQLMSLQNPQIITNEMRKVGELIVYKGVTTYDDYIEEKEWYGKKNLDIHLQYIFAIGYDLNKVNVENINGYDVTIGINKKDIVLKYIEVDEKETKIISNKNFFMKPYDVYDLSQVYNNAQLIVRNRIKNTEQIFSMAEESLKENLESIIKKLGYKNVKFDVD